MKIFLLLSIILLSNIGYSQSKQPSLISGVKTLTVQEEIEANKYDVNYYGLDLHMSNLNTNVAGTATIKAKLIEDLDSVVLELFPTLIISDIRVNGNPVPYTRTSSVLRVPVNQTAEFNFSIEVDYAGTPPNPGTNPFGGSGVSNVNVSEINSRVTWTVSCPFLAHEWFPCKQILKDKADSCDVNITVPSTCKVGSNGILTNTVDLGNGTTRFEWKHRRPILYYLICATIAPYTEYTVYAHPSQLPGDSIKVQNFIYGNSSTLAACSTQCDLLPGFIELYSDQYGLYPFYEEKYGQCFAPLGGGMEHQTMTTIGVNEKKITAHELSHQWWGDHVGIFSFSDVWLSEGFATYSEYVMLENMYPSEKASLLSGWHNSVMSSLGGSVYHLDTLDVNRIYNSRLTYKKGASIIHTLRHIVNNDGQFFQTLRDFQTDFHDSVAIGLDIKDAFEISTGLTLTNFFNEWYFGEGYPTYSAKWNSIGSALVVQINHTVSMPAVTPTFTNPIELKFTRNGQPDTIVRFNISDNSEEFSIYGIGQVTGISSIDPNNWVVNKTSTITNDPTLQLSVEEKKPLQSYLLFPNPTDTSFSIEGEDDQIKSIIIYDAKGKCVKSIHGNIPGSISIEELNAGIYSIDILKSDSKTETHTLIVK